MQCLFNVSSSKVDLIFQNIMFLGIVQFFLYCFFAKKTIFGNFEFNILSITLSLQKSPVSWLSIPPLLIFFILFFLLPYQRFFNRIELFASILHSLLPFFKWIRGFYNEIKGTLYKKKTFQLWLGVSSDLFVIYRKKYYNENFISQKHSFFFFLLQFRQYITLFWPSGISALWWRWAYRDIYETWKYCNINLEFLNSKYLFPRYGQSPSGWYIF